MPGIPTELNRSLSNALMQYGPFFSNRELFTYFMGKEELSSFTRQLVEADSPSNRVNFNKSNLIQKRNNEGENALVILLRVLSADQDPGSESRNELLQLANELDIHLTYEYIHNALDTACYLFSEEQFEVIFKDSELAPFSIEPAIQEAYSNQTRVKAIVEVLKNKQCANGQPALVYLLNTLSHWRSLRDTCREKLKKHATKLTRITTSTPFTPNTPSKTKTEEQTIKPQPTLAPERLERIINRNMLKNTAWLEQGLHFSKCICRIRASDGRVGTGFLIAPNLLMTNNHVLPNQTIAADATAQFNYEEDAEGNTKPSYRYQLDTTAFHTNRDLDYTIVGIKADPDLPPLRDWGHVILAPDVPIERNGHVTIIQHPEGGLKKIGYTDNIITGWDEVHLWYTTDTMRGSSGSPVFNDNWQVVAIHHAGGERERDGEGTRFLDNEGILMSAIKADAGTHWPGQVEASRVPTPISSPLSPKETKTPISTPPPKEVEQDSAVEETGPSPIVSAPSPAQGTEAPSVKPSPPKPKQYNKPQIYQLLKTAFPSSADLSLFNNIYELGLTFSDNMSLNAMLNLVFKYHCKTTKGTERLLSKVNAFLESEGRTDVWEEYVELLSS